MSQWNLVVLTINSLTAVRNHADGRSNLHVDRSMAMIWDEFTGCLRSSSTCWSHVRRVRPGGRLQSGTGKTHQRSVVGHGAQALQALSFLVSVRYFLK